MVLLPNFKELKHVANAHYILNTILAISFPVLKGTTFLCDQIFTVDGECGFDSREREILMFLAVIIVWKGRKATNWLHYISNIYMFSKIANIFLFLRADPLIGIAYVLIVVVISVAFPEPVYNGPEKITYFNGEDLFNELARDRRTTWFVMFYATWSPDCKHVNPIFAELSEKFTLPNLRFGKLDVGRWPKEAERFRVNAHPSSRQLPTICCFQDAKELRRRPLVNDKRRAIPFVFNHDNCVLEYDLLNIYNQCKESMSKQEKKKYAENQDQEDKKDN